MTRRRARILVVDDSRADVRLLREAVREETINAELHAVEDGEHALEHLRGGGEWPDLVLLDLNLPRKDGREVLAAIKSDPDLKSIPVIILSTSAAPDDVADCYALHANSYLVKPMGLDEFGALVRALDAFWLRAARLPNGWARS
jgi:CheY-like chemotaxis protein